MEIQKYVIIFCKKDDKGNPITKNFPDRTPYGYHHIVGAYPKVLHRLVAMIYAETSEADVLSIARILANDLPVEVDPDFYLKF